LITGASSGLGAELARAYARQGITLGLVGRSEAKLQDVARDCREAGATVEYAAMDVADADKLTAWIDGFETRSAVDLVIANAGTSGGPAPGSATEGLELATRQVRTNLIGVMNTVEPLLPRFLARGAGRIVVVSSIAGYRGLPYSPAYSASKNAVRAFGEGLRGAYKKSGIHVSVVCPGYIRTPMTEVNTFPMPFIMDADKAAKIIQRGLARAKSRIAFPLVFYAAMWLLNLLPLALTDPIMARLPTKSALPNLRKIP